MIVELAYWRLLPRYRDNETLLHGSFVLLMNYKINEFEK